MVQTNHDLLVSVREFLRLQLLGLKSEPRDTDAWDEFFAIYDAMIRRFAGAAGFRGHELDECVQEVWIAVLEHLETFEIDPERGRFRTWLYQVVRSKATDLLRRKNRGAKVSLSDSSELVDAATERPTDRLDRLWEQQLFQVLLDDLRQRVTEESFAIFEAHLVREEGYDVIAERHGVTPGSARTRYHRTLQKFRTLCERYTARAE